MKNRFSQFVLAALVTSIAPMSVFGLTCYKSDFEDGVVPGAWNWTGGGATTNVASIVDYNGSKWRQMESAISGASSTTGRYGYKMDFSMTGNTSTNAADYFVEFDVVNLSGNWTTVNMGIALMSKVNSAGTTEDTGHGFPNVAVPQGSVVHVKWQLSQYNSNWWQNDAGTDWVLTHPNWSYEINMPDTAITSGAAWTQRILIDNFRVVLGSDVQAYNPTVSPANVDGTSGALVPGSLTNATATLGWSAGGDPVITRGYTVNPDIYGHYIYLSRGDVAEPNFLDMTLQVHNADPALTDPLNSYGPVTLRVSTAYSWRVDEAIKYPNGAYSAKDDPNTIKGAIWKFTTVAADAAIVTGPAHTLTDASGNATITVVGNSAATSYAWFKVGSPDVKITDGGVYSGATTATLTITGATVATEGKYYAIAYNSSGKASSPSTSVKLWTRRLMSHFNMDTFDGGIATDSVSGYTITAANATAGQALMPVLGTGMTELGANDMGLNFANVTATPANTAYANASAGIVDYKDITINVWVKWDGGNNWQRVIDCGNDTNNYIFISPSNGSNIVFAIKRNGTENAISTARITPGTWHMITATLNGTQSRLFVNGELKASGTTNFDPVDIAAVNNYIGKSQWPDPYLNGTISDLKIYSYARSASEIAQDYLSVKGGYVCDRTLPALPYDFVADCQIDILDFAKFAATWMNTIRIYPTSGN